LTTLLEVSKVNKSYRVSTGPFMHNFRKVLHDISFSIQASQVVAVVGESGSGKSTLARQLVMLERPDSGEILFHGQLLEQVSGLHSKVRMIFQNPQDSLNPRRRIYDQLESSLTGQPGLDDSTRRERVFRTLQQVGLDPAQAGRFPHMFSGGQLQRVAIARALIPGPELVIADEAVSALDISVQAQILNLILQLKEELSMSWLFITHDIGVARAVSDFIVVIYAGRVVETGRACEVINSPLHPYTIKLMDSMPGKKDSLATSIDLPVQATGEPVNDGGCCYRKLCSIADEECAVSQPRRTSVNGRSVYCFKVK
jgi:dipeptide transport system ATP-binding protein